MKTYRLKKWYPGLPDEWKKFPVAVFLNEQKQYYKGGKSPIPVVWLPVNEVETNPEFWAEVEEVEEKKYVIQDNFPPKIKSIKRLSDGDVFTVGDQIETSVDDSPCIIYSFPEKNGRLMIECTHSYLANIEGIDLLSDMRHPRSDDKPIYSKNQLRKILKGWNFVGSNFSGKLLLKEIFNKLI